MWAAVSADTNFDTEVRCWLWEQSGSTDREMNTLAREMQKREKREQTYPRTDKQIHANFTSAMTSRSMKQDRCCWQVAKEITRSVIFMDCHFSIAG